MRKKQHPLSGTIYEDLGDGLVRVTRGEASGVFKTGGQWVEGDITQADLHMLVWVGGRELPPGANFNQRVGREIVHD
jgi:hypothetical protein